MEAVWIRLDGEREGGSGLDRDSICERRNGRFNVGARRLGWVGWGVSFLPVEDCFALWKPIRRFGLQQEKITSALATDVIGTLFFHFEIRIMDHFHVGRPGLFT